MFNVTRSVTIKRYAFRGAAAKIKDSSRCVNDRKRDKNSINSSGASQALPVLRFDRWRCPKVRFDRMGTRRAANDRIRPNSIADAA